MSKTVRKHYMEDESSKKWLNKNIPPMKHSAFIREAVKEKITKTKEKK